MGALKLAIVWRLPRPVVGRLRFVKRSLARKRYDEGEIVASSASTRQQSSNPVLVDVGGYHGTVTNLFLGVGSPVVACEPDPSNRAQFKLRHRWRDLTPPTGVA